MSLKFRSSKSIPRLKGEMSLKATDKIASGKRVKRAHPYVDRRADRSLKVSNIRAPVLLTFSERLIFCLVRRDALRFPCAILFVAFSDISVRLEQMTGKSNRQKRDCQGACQSLSNLTRSLTVAFLPVYLIYSRIALVHRTKQRQWKTKRTSVCDSKQLSAF